MRILYLINFAGKGGTEKYVKNLVEAYHGKGAECYFAYNVHGLLADWMEEKGIPSFRVEMRSAYDIAAAKKVADLCRKNKIDIIHTQFPRENYIAVMAKFFYRKVKLFNTSHLIINTGAFWRIANKIMTRFDEKIFAVCTYGKDTLIRNGVCEDKIEVVFNGIIPPEKTASNIRTELGITDDTFVISTLTRYSAEKGMHFLIDTAARLKNITDRKFAFVIAGDGDMFDEISQKSEVLGLNDVVYRIGYRTDTSNILFGSDLFVNLSATEALSFAILEALGHGLPVVATDVGGTSDIINSDSECGTLVRYENVDECANAILQYMEDAELCARCSDGALRTVREKFDLEKLLTVIFNRYEISVGNGGNSNEK